MRYIDLFGGIGGFTHGIKKATERQNKVQGLGPQNKGVQKRQKKIRSSGHGYIQSHWDYGYSGQSSKTYFRKWQCVGYYDNDKYAVQTYNKNFGTSYEATDITTVSSNKIPEHDLLIAGFPCQSFSIAGKRKGFNDTRGTLFFEIARIARDKRPKYLLLENVKGLLNHDKGKTFATILETLSELGYSCEWEVLNSKNFGVPQNRERVFIIGHLGGFSGRQIFPLGENTGKNIKISEGMEQTASTINTSIGRNQSDGQYIQTKRAMIIHNIYGGFKEGIREYNEYSPTIRTPKGGGHLPLVVGAAWRTRTYKGQPGRYEVRKDNISNQLTTVQKDSLVKIDMKIANTVTPDAYLMRGERKRVNGKAVLTSAHERRIRRLTPTECERLQGFPDNWTAGVSDTQRYKQLGNAVTTNVVEAIITQMQERLNGV
jgi:DNA (cytosine-5)-methyltransferase 1